MALENQSEHCAWRGMRVASRATTVAHNVECCCAAVQNLFSSPNGCCISPSRTFTLASATHYSRPRCVTMAALPSRPVAHVTGEQGVLIVKAALPPAWICREKTLDYGIDLEIEIVTKELTGLIFFAQVKGHENVKADQQNRVTQSGIKMSTYHYWKRMPVPVVLFAIDTTNRVVYWSPSERHSDLKKENQETLSYSFKRWDASSAAELHQYVESFANWQAQQQHVANAPVLEFLWNERMGPNTMGYDLHMRWMRATAT